MKLVLLSVASVSGLVLVCPVDAEVGKLGEGEIRKTIDLNPSSEAADLIAQGVTRVTGVEINQTTDRLELILETAAGGERLVPLILPEGNDLVIDILDATLAFSIRNGVTETNPAPGISRIMVNKVDDSSIRLTITGEKQAPSAEVVPGRDDLVLSITPEGTTAEQTPDEEIEVIATGEAEDNDYDVDEATTATRTDTPIRDIPQSIQVIPLEPIRQLGIFRNQFKLFPDKF